MRELPKTYDPKEVESKLYLTAVDRYKDRASALLADLAAAMNAYVPK